MSRRTECKRSLLRLGVKAPPPPFPNPRALRPTEARWPCFLASHSLASLLISSAAPASARGPIPRRRASLDAPSATPATTPTTVVPKQQSPRTVATNGNRWQT